MITKYTEDLCLVVTERCNLNCVYCQSDKSFKGIMNWECARRNLDRFLSTSEAATPSVTFMGGEPFLAFKLIEELVAYAETSYPEKSINYTIVTNGTLVHGDIQKWIHKHQSNVQVVLSLDGIGENHDLNRCKSLKMIDLNFFRSLKKPIVNTVFTPQTIGQLADTTILLHQYGFLVKGFFADGEPWEDQHTGVIAEQLMRLISFYLAHPDTAPISLLCQPLFYLTSEKPVRRCGTEKFEEVSVSADGTLWACHRCSPFENHGTWKIPEKYLGLTNACHLLDECDSCFLEKICNACPASNAAIMDDKEQSQTMCGIRKLLFKANAYLALSMLSSENDYKALRFLSDEKKRHLVESAIMIMDKL